MLNSERSRAIGRGVMTTIVAASLLTSTALGQSVDVSQWSPEYVRSIAGTETFDPVGHCNSVTPTY